jgi:hypothetical protein
MFYRIYSDFGMSGYAAFWSALKARPTAVTGVPFHRIENLEKRLGVPLPSATQWEMAKEAAE